MLYALFDSLNIVQFVCHCHNVTQMLKSSHSNANLQLSCIKVILCRRSADRLDRLLLAIKPVVENRHSTDTDAAEVDRCNLPISRVGTDVDICQAVHCSAKSPANYLLAPVQSDSWQFPPPPTKQIMIFNEQIIQIQKQAKRFRLAVFFRLIFG